MNRLQEELQIEAKKAVMIYCYGCKVNTALLEYGLKTRNLDIISLQVTKITSQHTVVHFN